MSPSASAPSFSVCVYCGARPGDESLFTETAQQVGQWIGQRGGQLVYGGGSNGLMGVVADATLAAGGRVVGVIPDSLMKAGIAGSSGPRVRAIQAPRCGAATVCGGT